MKIILLLLLSIGYAQAAMNHDGMIMDETGMIMNHNPDKLPKDCPKISEDVDITVHAGLKYGKKFKGKMFAFDQQQWDVKPCSRLNITLINDDEIRHQLMIHGLPGYLYPKGMFTIEINQKGQKTASLIMPSKPKTYLVHCELSQHMEKGMKAQLKVDGGDGDLPSIPGISEAVTPDIYEVNWGNNIWVVLGVSVLMGLGIPLVVFRKGG